MALSDLKRKLKPAKAAEEPVTRTAPVYSEDELREYGLEPSNVVAMVETKPQEKRVSRSNGSYLPDIQRSLPQSEEAEQGVICSMLIQPASVIPKCAEQGVFGDYFHNPAHVTIYGRLMELWREGKGIDLVTLVQVLRDKRQLDQCGGPSYISSLFTFVATAANAGYYIEILREKYTLRQMIGMCSEYAGRPYDEQDYPAIDFLEDVEQRIFEIKQSCSKRRVPEAFSLTALAEIEPDEEKTLLGRRFLCIGGGLIFVGPSGIGKSSASVQQDILWGMGREAFGIKPKRPLKILCIQAENDAGDLGEMARGVSRGLGLTDGDMQKLGDNVLYVTEKARTGTSFLSSVVTPLLAIHRPDILRIDPLMAFLGADVSDVEATAAFLRNGLNPLLDEYSCAAIINHHTPKVVNRDTSGWRSSDWMYSGAGSADVTNWARAALVIDPTHEDHLFRFIAAKRGTRIEWKDEHDKPMLDRYFQHDTKGGICWTQADPEQDAAVRNNKSESGKHLPAYSKDDILNELSIIDGVRPGVLQKQISEMRGMSKSTFYRLSAELREAGKLIEKIREDDKLWFRASRND